MPVVSADRQGRRLQLSRAAGAKLPATGRSVAHPTRWRNPYRPVRRSQEGNAEAVEHFRRYLCEHPDLVAAARRELAGWDLACWCPPGLPCHADVWLRVVAGEDLCS